MKLLSKLKDLFKRKGIAKERNFLSDSESEKAVLRLLEKENFRFLYLDNLTLEILQSKKRETSKLIETYLSNSNSGISESSSTYLLKDYLKAVDEADLISLDSKTKHTRFLKEHEGLNFVSNTVIPQFLSLIFHKFSNKRILILCSHASLVEIQYAKKYADKSSRGGSEFKLKCLDVDQLLCDTDKSNCYEGIDAIKMALLSYSCDVLLIQASPYSLPISLFATILKCPCAVIDNSFYELFDIYKTKDSIPFSKKNAISLEDYHASTSEDFNAINHLSKTPLD